MKYLSKALDGLTFAMFAVAGVALLLMMLVVVLDVSLKYLFNQPVPGTLEMVSYWFMAACAFLPLGLVQKNEGHIAMTLATEWLPERALRLLMGVILLIGAAYMALFAWSSALEAMEMTSVGESSSAIYFEVRIWPARWCVPVGTGLTALWMLLQGLTRLFGGRRA